MRYEGDNFDEEEMVDWLTDPNVMEVTDRIERVNRKMLEKLMARNEYLGVVFCECWKDGPCPHLVRHWYWRGFFWESTARYVWA